MHSFTWSIELFSPSQNYNSLKIFFPFLENEDYLTPFQGIRRGVIEYKVFTILL